MQTLRKGREEHIPNDGQWLPQEVGGGGLGELAGEREIQFCCLLVFLNFIYYLLLDCRKI